MDIYTYFPVVVVVVVVGEGGCGGAGVTHTAVA